MPIKHPFIPLTLYQEQVLTGLMLGDGHLAINGKAINASLMVSRAIKDKDYLQYEADLFQNLLAPRYCDAVQYSKSFNKTHNRYKEAYSFATSNNPSLTVHQKRWYQNKIKIVPLDLQLSSISVAHWVADDGSVDYNKLPYRLRLELSTHGFTKTEVEFLANLLNERYHEEFLVRGKNKKGKKYWIIKAYDSACRELFADIDPYFKMDRKRIWDKPESRFWTDQPERQISKVKIAGCRRELFRRIVENGNPITLKQIAEQLGYAHNDRFDYRSVNRILKPYLESGQIIKDMDKHNNNLITIRVIK